MDESSACRAGYRARASESRKPLPSKEEPGTAYASAASAARPFLRFSLRVGTTVAHRTSAVTPTSPPLKHGLPFEAGGQECPVKTAHGSRNERLRLFRIKNYGSLHRFSQASNEPACPRAILSCRQRKRREASNTHL